MTRVVQDFYFKQAKVCTALRTNFCSPLSFGLVILLELEEKAAYFSSAALFISSRSLQAQGYVARSAFKLLEIQKEHRILSAGTKQTKYICDLSALVHVGSANKLSTDLSPGASVLDLGCCPGAWVQVAAQAVWPAPRSCSGPGSGFVLGVDVKAGPSCACMQKYR